MKTLKNVLYTYIVVKVIIPFCDENMELVLIQLFHVFQTW